MREMKARLQELYEDAGIMEMFYDENGIEGETWADLAELLRDEASRYYKFAAKIAGYAGAACRRAEGERLAMIVLDKLHSAYWERKETSEKEQNCSA